MFGNEILNNLWKSVTCKGFQLGNDVINVGLCKVSVIDRNGRVVPNHFRFSFLFTFRTEIPVQPRIGTKKDINSSFIREQ